MKNLSMKTKLVGGFFIPVILTTINVIFGILSMKSVARATGETLERMERNSAIFSILILIFSIIITVAVALSLIQAIVRSVSQLSDAAKEIALGHVDIKMVKYANDEFGELVDEYARVINNIKYQANVADEISHGNLMVSVKPNSAEDVLGNALRTLVERNHHALSNINDAAYQVTTSSSQVASASESLAQGATEQASAIEEITASISEIAEKTKQNATQANDAADLMSDALGDVQKGNTQMQDMMAAMEEINKSSESISKIIKVIDDIAFQTNILALNAAVEAARAGEAGKGFAVVAEEVRSLAAKSAAAAAETAELIEDSIHKVEAGSKIADDTAHALGAITTGVSKSETMIREIAESSNYQATAVAQVNQAIGQVSQVVQTNSATSQECAAASEELSNQALRMRELLAVYKLGNTSNLGSTGSAAQIGSSQRSSVDEDDTANEPIISLGDDFGKY